MRKIVIAMRSAISVSMAVPMAVLAQAQDVAVKITNLTNAINFTPLLVTAHDQSLELTRECCFKDFFPGC